MSIQNPRNLRHRLWLASIVFVGLILFAFKPPLAQANASYQLETVSISSHGETLAGQLFLPPGEGPFAAVSIIGPVAFVKEQSPLQYASRLVQQGIAALIFDPRYHGASSGEPRRLELPSAKIEDLIASVDFLANHDRIDSQRIGIVGICQGVNWAIEATVRDARVKSLALVAGHYLMPEVAEMYLGSTENVTQRIQRAKRAREVYEQTGEVAYIPITGSDQALLTHPLIDDWYRPWANHSPWLAHRGTWENRITAMSEAEIWGWRIDQTLTRLKTDVVMIHADRAATGPRIPRQLFSTIPASNKRLHWIKGANQLMFYESPITIDQVITPLTHHFNQSLL